MRCGDCGGPIYTPPASEMELLPLDWRKRARCPSCLIHGKPDLDNEVLLARRKQSLMPEPLWTVRLSDLRALDEQDELLDALERWSMGHLSGLFLHGEVGRGKTYMAAGAANGLIRRRAIRWVSATQLLSGLRARFDDPVYRLASEVLHSQHPLILDDLGQERPSDAAREVLHSALDMRHVRGIPLLITSNLLPSELGDRYGAWLPSRIALMERHRALGDDLRLQGAA